MTTYKDKDIITILGNIPVFQGLTEADYSEITPLLKHERYLSGDQIIKEGTHGDSMCIIISGAVKITKSGDAGEEILLEARILAVSDVIEAMCSHRPYRASLGLTVTLEELDRNKGVLYDPAVVEIGLQLFAPSQAVTQAETCGLPAAAVTHLHYSAFRPSAAPVQKESLLGEEYPWLKNWGGEYAPASLSRVERNY